MPLLFRKQFCEMRPAFREGEPAVGSGPGLGCASRFRSCFEVIEVPLMQLSFVGLVGA